MEGNKDEKEIKNIDYLDEKMNFFKTVWYSITKIEKYPEMSAKGFKHAIKYFVIIILVLALSISTVIIFQTNSKVQKVVDYINQNLPDFSYKDGILTFNEQVNNPLIIDENNLDLGKIIIDLELDNNEETINQYKQQINNDNGKGVIILKDKIISQNSIPENETVEYKYSNVFGQMNITEFGKKDIFEYVKGNEKIKLYISLLLTLIITYFIWYAFSTIWIAVILAILGHFVALISKMKMKFIAIFNMAIYSLTLSIILEMIYIITNIFTKFKVTYFQLMYISVAFIYLVAAIFILRAEFIKKQGELIKISEEQKKIKEQSEEEKREQEEKENRKKKDKEDQKKKNKEEKDKNKDNQSENEEPEGSGI